MAPNNPDNRHRYVSLADALRADHQELNHCPSEESDNNGPQVGSSLGGAIFNFTNSIVGAGAIGLGGAIAASGGFISVLTIVVFGILSKLSLDLLVQLCEHGSYEDLGKAAYGVKGQMAVVVSKFMYSFGCLVAYIIVIKDNLAPAILNLIDPEESNPHTIITDFLHDSPLVTWAFSLLIILPLCLFRNMTFLSSTSFVSVMAMVVIVAIVIHLYFQPSIRQHGGTVYQDWFQVHPEYLQCLGTFVFTFASQHTVHLAFASLRPELRTLDKWKTVSTCSVGIAGSISLAIGVFVYMTFWSAAQSDIFDIYPAIPIVNVAKLLLCITMLLTFPLPFFACRELVIVLLTWQKTIDEVNAIDTANTAINLEEPLLSEEDAMITDDDVPHEDESIGAQRGPSGHLVYAVNSIVLPGDEKQLKLPYHVLVTVKLWFVVTWLAIASPNLGDVLNLIGCVSGSFIAFIFPGLFSVRLNGSKFVALTLLTVGCLVLVVGSFYSVKQLIADMS